MEALEVCLVVEFEFEFELGFEFEFEFDEEARMDWSGREAREALPVASGDGDANGG